MPHPLVGSIRPARQVSSSHSAFTKGGVHGCDSRAETSSGLASARSPKTTWVISSFGEVYLFGTGGGASMGQKSKEGPRWARRRCTIGECGGEKRKNSVRQIISDKSAWCSLCLLLPGRSFVIARRAVSSSTRPPGQSTQKPETTTSGGRVRGVQNGGGRQRDTTGFAVERRFVASLLLQLSRSQLDWCSYQSPPAMRRWSGEGSVFLIGGVLVIDDFWCYFS